LVFGNLAGFDPETRHTPYEDHSFPPYLPLSVKNGPQSFPTRCSTVNIAQLVR